MLTYILSLNWSESAVVPICPTILCSWETKTQQQNTVNMMSHKCFTPYD